jgi:DNA polymerase-3 subunit gamma/tau
MSEIKLNLARKWRSRNFDQIVGQELSVRMLKNSLYRGQYFPVYLFSGQRGCGKTTTARVFATAINCAKVTDFQNDPRITSIPCLVCDSCTAMLAGNHPDFIEIDAASHTGVDNVRNIIEASSLMPLMGGKKIYLIDEAHMLSKAAFNAFLKILEEPPMSVLFILATTDQEKIIETVRSRCFQLFFKPIDSNDLLEHLHKVCLHEDIRADQPGLELIVKESGGSARDALNLVEQIRFSSSAITKLSVLKVLGHIDDERLIALLETVLTKSAGDVLQLLSAIKFETYSADYVWRRLIELTRALVWMKYGVPREQVREQHEALQQLARVCSLKRINQLLRDMYASESMFLRTTAQHLLLEMLFLRLAHTNSNDSEGGAAPASAQAAVTFIEQESELEDEEDDEDSEDDEEEEDEDEQEQDGKGFVVNWKHFAQEIETLNEPLLTSVFKQGEPTTFDKVTGVLTVEFARDLNFFNDMLAENKAQWQPLLDAAYRCVVSFNPQFVRESLRARVEKKQPMPVHTTPQPSSQSAQKPMYENYQKRRPTAAAVQTPREPMVDVSDAAQWPKSQLLLKYFPGTITEIREQAHD